MSEASHSPWDSAEFLTDDETIIEYLKAALKENDPLIFLMAARNVARARGFSPDELPDGASGLPSSLEEEIRQILGPEVSGDFLGWRVLEDIDAGAGPETECERCRKLGTPRQQFEHMGVVICFVCADERIAELGAEDP